MTKIFMLVVAAGLLRAPGAPAASPIPVNPGNVRLAVAAGATIHPPRARAALRYDASTTEACRSFSDTSAEVCLLLALHVIRMSEKPLPPGAL